MVRRRHCSFRPRAWRKRRDPRSADARPWPPSGLVRGGASRRSRPTLQPGNTRASCIGARGSANIWAASRSRLAHARAGDMLESREALIGPQCALPPSRRGACRNASRMHRSSRWRTSCSMPWPKTAWPIGVRSMCAGRSGCWRRWASGSTLRDAPATGVMDDLLYVSPRTGRAVSGEAGAPYAGRLFALPAFLLGSQNGEAGARRLGGGAGADRAFPAGARAASATAKICRAARLRLDALAAHRRTANRVKPPQMNAAPDQRRHPPRAAEQGAEPSAISPMRCPPSPSARCPMRATG